METAKSKKLCLATILALLLCSSLASIANASLDDREVQTTPQGIQADSIDPPILIAPQDEALASDSTPGLILERENSTITTDEDPSNSTGDTQFYGDTTLYEAQSQIDYTTVIISTAATVAIALSAAIIVSKYRKK